MSNTHSIKTVPKFIVVEGIDGSGKTTACEKIKEILFEEGVFSNITRELGGTEFSSKVRDLFLHEDTNVSATTELLLISAGRRDHIENVVVPTMENNLWVICDRSYFSTIAYQGANGGASPEVLRTVNEIAMGGIKPDLLIYLDVTSEVSSIRRLNRTDDNDKMDALDNEYYDNARFCLKSLVQAAPFAHELDAIQNDQDELKELMRPLVKSIIEPCN